MTRTTPQSLWSLPKAMMTTTTVQVLLFASAREAAGNVSSVECSFGADEIADTTALRYACSFPWLCMFYSREKQLHQPLHDNVLTVSTFYFLRYFSFTLFIRRQLADRYPKLAPLVMDESNLTLAVNEEYVPEGDTIVLKTGDTVALIPPISGGWWS